ncbi:uncharacterized protein LOC110932023 [Helianthus annuus]|uniref:uncharacterized protein LOC110932023 n=1 Tax=Helianthus annuus TaxID=4232 RepID=UPI000B8FA10F|nr:uncharacterized protein LOC110932023 [Helianthus annuus]
MGKSPSVNSASPEEAEASQTESSASSDSTSDSYEKTDCDNSESVASVESTNESSEIVDSNSIKEESETTSGASVELDGNETTGAPAECSKENNSDSSEPIMSQEAESNSAASSDTACEKINDTNPIASNADQVIIEDWVEGDGVVCQKADDVCPKTSNLSADAPPYVRKDASEPALRGPSNKYVPPKPTVKNENAKSSECANCCKQRHMKQGRKVEQFTNKSSNKSYNSYSASVGWTGSGYAPYVKKQTCYNCGIPGHIARNCTHHRFFCRNKGFEPPKSAFRWDSKL